MSRYAETTTVSSEASRGEITGAMPTNLPAFGPGPSA